MAVFQFGLGTKIIMGHHVLDEIGTEIQRFGKKVLIVTDKGIKNAGLLAPLLAALDKDEIPYSIFDGVVSNPTIQNVDEAHNQLVENHCDVIVAIGGGSSIDAAKSVSIIATNGGSIRDYEGIEKFSADPLPVFAIPTTVGTGSEVTKGAVISDPERHVKMVIVSDRVYPVYAYLDERVVSGLPGPVCAATGIDALTHALEGYISNRATPITDSLNLHAIRMVGKYLRPAVAGDPDSLYQMLIASCIAGVGFHNSGLGVVHALANTMGGHFPVHHGVANAILLPYVMEFNLIANPSKFKDIAEALGEEVDGLSERDAAGLAVTAVRQLSKDVGIPATLREVGIEESAIPMMAKESLDQIDRPTNPRRNSVKDLEALYRAAF